MSRGVIVASDSNLEWLLPWWWSHFHFHNKHLPLFFVNLGMTASSCAWCKERGSVLPLSLPSFVQPRENIAPFRIANWEKLYGLSTWKARPSWFIKPSAMLASPFNETIWLDLDCEVLKPLDPMFDMIQDSDLGLARENESKIFNSGVVVFRKNAKLLQKWATMCQTKNHLFIGDQQVLSHMLQKKPVGFAELSPLCNWMAGRGYNPDAFVMHWSNQWGKMFIELYGGAQGFTSQVITS